MGRQGAALALAAVLAVAPASAQKDGAAPVLHPGARVIDARAPIVEAVIAGQPVRLRFDLAAHAPVILTPAAAARLGLGGDLRNGRKAKVRRATLLTMAGRVTVRIPYTVETVGIDGVAQQIVVAVPPGLLSEGEDGRIGPKALPYAEVRYQQRPPAGTDGETRLTLEAGNDFGGLYTPVRVGGETIKVEFAPAFRQSVGTAATGAILAGAVGGRLEGPERMVRIVYDIERPVRLLRLDRPFPIAGLSVGQVLMRIQDWEGRHPRPADADVDPDDILVLVGRDPQRSNRFLSLGHEVTGGCASIAWRRADDSLLLVCPRQGQN
jgi:hypothetical protein